MGLAVLFGCFLGMVAYFWLLFFSSWSFLALQVTALMAVVGTLSIGAWIGYTLAAIPPPAPAGKELEEEPEEAVEERGTS